MTVNHFVPIRITVDDVDGDLVSAEIRLGPASMVMRPIVNAAPPVTREIFWHAEDADGGRQRLVVLAHDAVAPTVVVRAETKLDVVGGFFPDPTIHLWDVDGNDRPEVVVADPGFDVNGKVDAGALVVFDLFQPPVRPATRRRS